MDLDKKDLLLEIYQKNGYVDASMFFSQQQEMQKFFEELDMKKELAQYLSADLKAMMAMTANERNAALIEKDGAAKILFECTRKRLKEDGIDPEQLYGKQPTDEELAEMVRERMAEYNVPQEEIDKVEAHNVRQYIDEGKDLSFELDDSPQAREWCRKEGIDYTTAGGKLYMTGSLQFEKFAAYPDTPEVREAFAREGVEAIAQEMDVKVFDRYKADLAQGNARGLWQQGSKARVLLVPMSWMVNGMMMGAKRMLNSRSRRPLLMAVGLGGALALGAAPIFVLMAACYMHKFGLFRRSHHEKGAFMNLYQQMTLRGKQNEGITVYREQVRNGMREGYYFYNYKGNVLKMPARDVRIPAVVAGVNLTYDQRERFRKGELVQLKDKNGREFGVRIDVTNPKLYALYGKAMKSDRNMTEVPKPDSDEIRKMEHIARYGIKGVRDIYGEDRYNTTRDVFLEKHGLRQKYWAVQSAELSIQSAISPSQKTNAVEQMQKADRILKDSANDFVLSQSKGRKL